MEKGVQEIEKVRQIDHACHVTSLASEHTLSLFIFSPSQGWKRNENKLSLNFLDVLSTQAIYFTTFSNVSYKLRVDPTHKAEMEIIEQ